MTKNVGWECHCLYFSKLLVMSKDSGPFKANILLAIKVTVKLLQEGRYIIIENYGAS